MKKLLCWGGLVSALWIMASCGPSAPAGAGLKSEGPQVEGVSSLKDNEAYIIRVDLPLWSIQNNKFDWMENLTVGDKVILFNQTEKHTYENAERDYSKVKTQSGKEGWIRSDYAVPKARLAVVKADKALVYAEPRDVKVTSKSLAKMALVAVLDEGASGDFVKVSGYDGVNTVIIKDNFVNKNDLSLDTNDVNLVILLTVAKGTKNSDVQKNLLNTALAKYSSSGFSPLVQAELDKLSTVQVKASTAANLIMAVNDDNVNLRQAPDEVNGSVIGSLKKGQQVQVVEQTNDSFTVSGKTAKWCKIADPAGWIFGAYLSENAN